MNGRQRYIIISGFQSLLLHDGSDGLFPITDPPLLQNTLTQGRFGGCHHVDAHVGALEVVEVNGFGYGITHLGNVREAFALEQFVLHRIVDALRLAISLGGDADTLAAIAGPMAYAFYREMPDSLVYAALKNLPDWMVSVNERFDKRINEQ